MRFMFSYSHHCTEDKEKKKIMFVSGRVDKYNRMRLIFIRKTRVLLFDIIVI